jgi:hypothetical protein
MKMTQLKEILIKNRLWLLYLIIFLLSVSVTAAQNKVVVVPLFGDETSCCACEGTLSVGKRWCDNGNGTVTDMTTCLVWLQKADWGETKPWRSNTENDWDDAHSRAGMLYSGAPNANLSDGSVLGDWRLPTKTELIGITTGDEYVRSSNMQLFTGVQPSEYWSSSTQPSNPPWMAWRMLMSTGGVGIGYKEDDNYVWPVRAGN